MLEGANLKKNKRDKQIMIFINHIKYKKCITMVIITLYFFSGRGTGRMYGDR